VKILKRKMRVETRVEKKSTNGTPKVTLRDDDQADRRVIREERSRRSDWEEPLKREESSNKAEESME
jgi:hypothetical protein